MTSECAENSSDFNTVLKAAIDAVVAIGWLAAELGPRLAELDINPLILRVEGQGVVAVDVRARLVET